MCFSGRNRPAPGAQPSGPRLPRGLSWRVRRGSGAPGSLAGRGGAAGSGHLLQDGRDQHDGDKAGGGIRAPQSGTCGRAGEQRRHLQQGQDVRWAERAGDAQHLRDQHPRADVHVPSVLARHATAQQRPHRQHGETVTLLYSNGSRTDLLIWVALLVFSAVRLASSALTAAPTTVLASSPLPGLQRHYALKWRVSTPPSKFPSSHRFTLTPTSSKVRLCISLATLLSFLSDCLSDLFSTGFEMNSFQWTSVCKNDPVKVADAIARGVLQEKELIGYPTIQSFLTLAIKK